jgi:hypothetical protein
MWVVKGIKRELKRNKSVLTGLILLRIGASE